MSSVVLCACMCYGNSDHMWSDSGIRVLAGSLANISAAGRLCEVSVWLLLLDYCMYFYTGITCFICNISYFLYF